MLVVGHKYNCVLSKVYTLFGTVSNTIGYLEQMEAILGETRICSLISLIVSIPMSVLIRVNDVQKLN